MFKYQELERRLEEEIRKGVYKPGDNIPSENELPGKYGVSKNTARKAIQELLEKGLIYRIQGKGTFVSEIEKVSKGEKKEVTTLLTQRRGEKEEIAVRERKEEEEEKVVNRKKTISRDIIKNELMVFVEEKSGQSIFKCYQCGKCSAGCPIAGYMDYLPHQIVRLLQIGDIATILSAKTIWYCAACFMCDSRCPKGIEISKIMESIRSYLLRKGIDYTNINEIDKSFLEEIPQQALVGNFRKLTG